MHVGQTQLTALPSDAILVHIGMHKTGTTAVQSLLASARGEMRPLGVHYPGRAGAHHGPANALIRRPVAWRTGGDAPKVEVWDRFAADARRHRSRVVISSEYLSRARPQQVTKLVNDLGRDRVYALLGVRHFAPLIVSFWQQALKACLTKNLDSWLHTNFAQKGPKSFWARQDPSVTLSRWLDVLGADRIFVIVVDEHDRTLLPTTFEHLLALPNGTLADRSPKSTNRGMSTVEAELLRRVNAAVGKSLSWQHYASLIRYGMVTHLLDARKPGSDERKPVLPEWALQQAIDEGQQLVQQIQQSEVRVIGDLRNLTDERRRASSADCVGNAHDGHVPMSAAVHSVVGTILSATSESLEPVAPPKQTGERTVENMTTRALAEVLVARLWRAARLRVSRLVRQ